MIAKLEEVTSNTSNDILTVSGTVRLYTDDESVVLHQRGISAKGNFNSPELKNILVDNLTQQMQGIIDAYNEKMGIIQGFYPDANTPQEALTFLVEEVENGITA